MLEDHIVSGLVAKRAEMAGLIDHHQKQVARLAADMHHLDATLKLFGEFGRVMRKEIGGNSITWLGLSVPEALARLEAIVPAHRV